MRLTRCYAHGQCTFCYLSLVVTGKPSAEQLAQIRTRKPAPPVIEVTLADGSKVPLWNTFKDQQVCKHV
jgi:hypothetical protein